MKASRRKAVLGIASLMIPTILIPGSANATDDEAAARQAFYARLDSRQSVQPTALANADVALREVQSLTIVGGVGRQFMLRDANGDRLLDLWYTQGPDVAEPMSIRTGRFSDFTFAFGSSIQIPAGLTGHAFVVDDFNRDGLPDIATAKAKGWSRTTISILSGMPDGSFTESSAYPVGLSMFSFELAGADLDADGYMDLVGVNDWGKQVFILAGGPGGRFVAQPSLSVDTGPDHLAIADYNADGLLDMVVSTAKQPYIMLNTGSGFAFAPSTLEGFADGTELVSADIDADGEPDLISYNWANGQVRMHYGLKSSSGFADAAQTINFCGPRFATTADMNLDGKLDLLIAGDCGVQVYFASGGRKFVQGPTLPGAANSVVVGDIDARFGPDLVVGLFNAGIKEYLQAGPASPLTAPSFTMTRDPGTTDVVSFAIEHVPDAETYRLRTASIERVVPCKAGTCVLSIADPSLAQEQEVSLVALPTDRILFKESAATVHTLQKAVTVADFAKAAGADAAAAGQAATSANVANADAQRQFRLMPAAPTGSMVLVAADRTLLAAEQEGAARAAGAAAQAAAEATRQSRLASEALDKVRAAGTVADARSAAQLVAVARLAAEAASQSASQAVHEVQSALQRALVVVSRAKALKTIRCKRGQKVIRVSAVNPACPAGWKRTQTSG